eukprot:CAMPEP_0204318466 /NCGR_PEP_ID=MMETSP0469-20131031/6551_1 /ASSEMBLY_ACC=CAM_ASM_000384 /TAXON_ID=2969 /ORGANISM="Oxyrrhis marina" /LENGTH=121 /DNA_ID=CAMNT_0051299521 /DNA_START=267 /DNA_END=629 /DNA_ORIENTATION=+
MSLESGRADVLGRFRDVRSSACGTGNTMNATNAPEARDSPWSHIYRRTITPTWSAWPSAAHTEWHCGQTALTSWCHTEAITKAATTPLQKERNRLRSADDGGATLKLSRRQQPLPCKKNEI